ncbi:MAG: nucleotidyltransferase family protein [Chloroflexota bacterium]
MGKDLATAPAHPWLPLGLAEQRFLLACLRQNGTVPSPPADLNWPALTRRASGDGLGPLLFQRFKNAPELLPAATLDQFKRNYYQNLSANHIRWRELERIGRHLAQHDIPLLVLKGAALSITIYSDPALRFMGDLDVAVPPEQAAEALALLQADGYEVEEHTELETAGLDDLELLRQQGWHVRLARLVHGKQVDLEFHWPLRQQVLVNQVARLDVQQVWATAVPLKSEANLWQPAPATMLLHLCLHAGLQHRFSDLGLRHYLDVDRLLRRHRREPGFWELFVAQVRAARASHTSYFCLLLAQRLLGTPLPAEVMAELAPPAWKRRLFDEHFTTADVMNRTRAFYDSRRAWWRLLTIERPADLLLGPLQALFPGPRYLANYYRTQSTGRLIAYTLWHPFHTLGRAGRRRWKRRP